MINKLVAITIAPSGGFTGIGTFGVVTDNGISTLSKIISMVIGVMTIVAIIWFVITLITGAIGIITSGGDKQALETARKKITTGAIGLLIVILALVLINLIGKILGINDILNINELFSKLL
jgi:hypothetical protein